MREILFRGKRTDNGQCVEGDLIQLHDGRKYIINNIFGACIDDKGNFINTESPFVCKVVPKTVGQYTGLVDRNGKRIFEGDIIKDCDYDHIHTVRYFGDEDYPAFDCHPEIQFCECNGLSHLVAVSAIEVIGNIHDNPELLERSKG